MIQGLIIGFLFGTIGISLLTALGDIIIAIAEFIKAKISIKIVECNAKINKINRSTEETHTRAIGFNTTFEEKEEDYE